MGEPIGRGTNEGQELLAMTKAIVRNYVLTLFLGLGESNHSQCDLSSSLFFEGGI